MQEKSRIMLISSFVILAIIYLLGYFIVYEPLESRLEEEIDRNFILHVNNAQTVSETYLNNLANSSKSVSNRVMIKNKIVEYHEGDITMQELIDFTVPYYHQSTIDVDDLIDEARIVDDQYVIEFANSDFEDYVIDYHSLDFSLNFELVDYNETYLIVVCSPIIVNAEVLGHDMLIYDITSFLASLEVTNYLFLFEIIEEGYALEEIIYEDSHVEYHLDVPYLEEVLVGEIEYDVLRASTIKFSRNVMIHSVLSFSIAVSILYYFIMKTYDKLIDTVEEDKKMFEELAKKDTLTNAWNRSYFIEWVEEHINMTEQESCIVMLDIDKFKFILMILTDTIQVMKY